MGVEDNKAVVRKFYENYARHTNETLQELFAPDFEAHGHSAKSPQNREEHINGIHMWNRAFSGTNYSVEQQLGEGDSVATRVAMRAVHDRGEFLGLPPTGKQVALTGASFERIENGKITERRISYDSLVLMQQLGLVPPPG